MRSSHYNMRWLAAIATLTIQPAASAGTSDMTATSAPIDAIWRVQSLPFEYSSMETFYNCDALEQKVRAILLAVGAHRSVAVQTNCQNGASNRIWARIAVATPVPASEENVRAASTFDSRDELVARLHRATLPTSADIPRFAAHWQTLSLAQIRDLSLTLGDCDLLRDMNDQVFPRISVRITQNKLTCNNMQASRIRPNIKVEALIAAPAQIDPVAQNETSTRTY